jgi:hypothetical protein
MASPITWLAVSGASANASGYASCKVPGTQTDATVYADADGTALSQPVDLDSSGRATIYTTSVVDLYLYDEDGTLTQTIERANAVHAGTVDVENAGFTGVNDAGQTVAEGLVSLDDVLTTGHTSTNGTDFKYMAATGATERDMYAVMRERGVSVKDYGAAGDGLTIDTTAFTSAIAVLKAAGGGVLVVPPGTYLVDAALTIDFSGLLVLGNGFNVSIIKSNSTTLDIFSVTGAYNFDVENVHLTASSASTGAGIYSKGQGCTFRKVKFTKLGKGINLDAGTFDVEIHRCNFQITSATTHGVFMQGSTAKAIRIIDNYFEGLSNTGIAAEVNGAGPVSDVLFFGNRCATLTSGFVVDAAATGSDYRIAQNYLHNCTTALSLGAAVGALNCKYVGLGNNFGGAAITDASLYTYAAVATVLNFGSTGLPFYIVSTGPVDLINKLGFPPGHILMLQFSGNVTVNHATATAGSNITLLLSGAVAFSATANDSLTLVFTGTSWQELARTVV